MNIGDTYKNKAGIEMTVVEINNSKDIVIEFKSGYRKRTTSSHVVTGRIKDKLSPSIFGVGIIGDGAHSTTSNSRETKAYKTWKGVLQRCYYKCESSNLDLSYQGCEVCDEWLNFQNFAEWFNKNHPMDGSSYQLDKDIKVIGNKVYSPEFCMIIKTRANQLIKEKSKVTLNETIGVHFCKDRMKYVSSASSESSKKRKIKRFASKDDAYNYYISGKVCDINHMFNDGEIDNELRLMLINKVKSL